MGQIIICQLSWLSRLTRSACSPCELC